MPTAKTETESQQEDTSVNEKLKISMDFAHSNTQASNQYMEMKLLMEHILFISREPHTGRV